LAAAHPGEPVLQTAVAESAGRGLRVLPLARAATPDAKLRDGHGRPALPRLQPVAFVALADQLRPEVTDSVTRFHSEGVTLKVLSGDDPRTVAVLAARAGLDARDPVAGAGLDDLDDPALDALVARTTVFGRVAPEQKERIVGVPTFFLTVWAPTTRSDGHLLGRLTHFVVPAAVITAAFGTALYAYLYESVTQFFTSGHSPAQVIHDFESYTGLTYGTDADFTTAAAAIGAQTGLSTFFCLASFVLILFLAPPARVFAAWTRPTGDRRPALLVAVLAVVFAAVLFIPVLSNYFGLTGPSPMVFALVLPALALWFAVPSAALRFRLFERFLGFEKPSRRG
jgi:hypothetical protein